MVSYPFPMMFRWHFYGLWHFTFVVVWVQTCCMLISIPLICVRVCVRKKYWGSVCRLHVYMCTLMQCSVGECVSHTVKSSSMLRLDDHLGTELSIWTVMEWSWSKRRGKTLKRGLWTESGRGTESLCLPTSHISVSLSSPPTSQAFTPPPLSLCVPLGFLWKPFVGMAKPSQH